MIAVIINGSAGVGKDTLIDMLKKYFPSVLNVSTVDPYREIPHMLGFKRGDKSEAYRAFLSKLKSVSKEANNYPVRYVLNTIEEFKDKDGIIFIHCREPEEIEEIKQEINNKVGCIVKTMLVTNKNVPQVVTNESDKNVYNYNYDIEVKNDGTLEDLKDKVWSISRLIIEGE